jgi:tRNA (guanine37-N1)-methyltransferase
VYANDLNPASVEYLRQNVILNHVQPSKLHSFNMDARAFLKHILSQALSGEAPHAHHIIMNLPAIALEFLDVFRGAYHPICEGGQLLHKPAALPTIHCYCFAPPDDFQTQIQQRLLRAMGSPVEAKDIHFHNVRNVSPGKDMFCVSFVLPTHIAHAVPSEASDSVVCNEKIEKTVTSEEIAEPPLPNLGVRTRRAGEAAAISLVAKRAKLADNGGDC